MGNADAGLGLAASVFLTVATLPNNRELREFRR
jgi:hypothetical protein